MTTITISRQFGSGGDEIAHHICEALNYHFFDKQMILEAAKGEGLCEDVIIDYSEDKYMAQGCPDPMFNGGLIIPYTGMRMGPENQDIRQAPEMVKLQEEDSIGLVQKAIYCAHQIRNMVIVGRGGQVILKDHPGVLHVRIIAPLEHRIQRVKKMLKQNEHAFFEDLECRLEAQAWDLIQQHDTASAEYIRRYYQADWADTHLYQAVLNTGKMNIHQAVKSILDLVNLHQGVEEGTRIAAA